jgi:Mg/Co/Ni transporter MgtE
VATPDASPAPGEPDDARVAPVGQVAQVRRAPRYRAFALAGAVAGAVVAVVASLVVAGVTGRDAELGYATLVAAVGAALLGALAGAVVAVLLDRRS